MGFGLCHGKPSSVATFKAAPPTAGREATARVTHTPEASSTGAESQVPALTEVMDCTQPHTRRQAPPYPLAQWSSPRRASLVKSGPVSGGPSPLYVAKPPPPRPTDQLGRHTAVGDSTSSHVQVPLSILSSGSRHTSDPSSRTRLYESTAEAPSNIRHSRPNSLTAMDVDAVSANGGNRAASPVLPGDGGPTNGILRPSSAYADTPNSALNVRPGSTDRRNSSQSSGPPSTVMPRRGSVRFLGSGDDDDLDAIATAARETSVYQWSRRGSLDISLLPLPPKPPSVAEAPAETPKSPSLRRRTSIRQNGSTSNPASVQGDCSLAHTGPSSASLESPPPLPSSEEPTVHRLSPRLRHDKRGDDASGAFGGLAPFGSIDVSERSGLFSAEGGSTSLVPPAVLASAASGASQSPKSILLRPSSISSPAAAPCLPLPGTISNWSENMSPGGHRGSRRRTSECNVMGSDQRPSFKASVTRRASDGRQRRRSSTGGTAGGGDNSSDDEQIVQSVRSTMQRLQRSEASCSGRSSNSVGSSNSNGTGNAEGRALSAAARVSTILLPLPKPVQLAVCSATRRPTGSTANSSTTSPTHYNEYSLPSASNA